MPDIAVWDVSKPRLITFSSSAFDSPDLDIFFLYSFPKHTALVGTLLDERKPLIQKIFHDSTISMLLIAVSEIFHAQLFYENERPYLIIITRQKFTYWQSYVYDYRKNTVICLNGLLFRAYAGDFLLIRFEEETMRLYHIASLTENTIQKHIQDFSLDWLTGITQITLSPDRRYFALVSHSNIFIFDCLVRKEYLLNHTEKQYSPGRTLFWSSEVVGEFLLQDFTYSYMLFQRVRLLPDKVLYSDCFSSPSFLNGYNFIVLRNIVWAFLASAFTVSLISIPIDKLTFEYEHTAVCTPSKRITLWRKLHVPPQSRSWLSTAKYRIPVLNPNTSAELLLGFPNDKAAFPVRERNMLCITNWFDVLREEVRLQKEEQCEPCKI